MKKGIVLGVVAAACLVATAAATAAAGLGEVAQITQGNLVAITRLLTAGAYIAGVAFTIGAIVKFKAHKDNPTQIPIGQPIALLFVGAALAFLPGMVSKGGATMFGSSGVQTTLTGVSTF